MYVKKFIITLAVVLFTSIGSISSLNAHDTDIYSNPTNSGSEPLILFALDYRSNLGATACNGNECDSLINAGYMPATGPYTFFDLLRGVFRKVLDPLGGFKIGFMMNHDSGSNCAGPQPAGAKCSNGGYILHGLKSVTAGTDPVDTYETAGEDPNKVELFEKLDHIPLPQGNVAHSYQGKELYFELFRYLTGQKIYNAHNGFTDYGTTNAANIDDNADAFANGTEADGDITKAWLSYDTSIEQNAGSNPSNETYKSPLNSSLGGDDCSGIFVINIMFQVSNQEDDSDAAIKETKANGGMDSLALQGNNNSFDTVIKWMYDVDLADGTFGTASDLNGKQNVTSYFLSANVNQTTNGYADAGGTTRALELSADPAKLEQEIRSILTQILSVSTTFVAPSVAVNVYNRSQVQNDVFIAMFQAEASGKPSWVGNTKKFEFGELNGVLGILDANGNDAVNPIDGRVKNEALSFWTNPNELVHPDTNDDFLIGADGRFVDRGGCGSRIPGYRRICTAPNGNNPPITGCTDQGTPGMSNPSAGTKTVADGPRKVFTEAVSGTGALRDLNADGTTASTADILAAFAGASAAGTCANNEAWDTACNLIRYTRGMNDDGSNRLWMLGDPLHSRPLALNYGNPSGATGGYQDIRILFGSNDGLIHSVRNTKSDGTQDGVEGWSFMPLEAMKITKRIKKNVISSPHQYGADGSVVAYVLDQDGDGNIETGDKVHAYFGLRRGGRAYYGLDVTDPDNPSQLWRITNNTAGFSELGQSWSTPKVGHMLFGGTPSTPVNTPAPVIIFAGGYDPNKDSNTVGHTAAAGGNDSMGRGIFIVNAETGALIWKATYGASTGSQSSTHYTHAEMLDSIPSDVTAVDTDGNGLLDRIYVGDTGGKVWRVDMLSNDQSFWTVSKLFSAGRHYNGAASEDQRFFYAPDYVQARETTANGGTAYDAIIIGTGDRENPLDVAVNNWFYVIKDTDTATGSGTDSNVTPGSAGMANLTCKIDGNCAVGTTFDTTEGFRIPLKCPWQATGDCGEKALATPITIAGRIYFTTYQPADGTGTSCDPNEGSGFLYIVSLDTGDAVEDLDLSKLGLEYYTKLSSGGIPSEVVSLGGGKLLRPDLKVTNVNADSGFRTFWFEHAFEY